MCVSVLTKRTPQMYSLWFTHADLAIPLQRKSSCVWCEEKRREVSTNTTEECERDSAVSIHTHTLLHTCTHPYEVFSHIHGYI